MNKNNMGLLMKIGKEEYIKSMYNEEYLYFNPISYFIKHEKDAAKRYDYHECSDSIRQLGLLKLILPTGEEFEVDGSNQLYTRLENLQGNIMCLHHIDFDQNLSRKIFDRKLLEFGDKALVIKDNDKFIDLVNKAVKNIGFDCNYGCVKYYDKKKHEGNLTPFLKDNSYEFQKEYRIFISPGQDTPIRLFCPGLKEISFIIDLKNIHYLKLVPE